MDRRVDDWLMVIRTEFEEVPGLSLTIEEAATRWNVDGQRLQPILDGLVAAGFLCRGAQGQYFRPSDS